MKLLRFVFVVFIIVSSNYSIADIYPIHKNEINVDGKITTLGHQVFFHYLLLAMAYTDPEDTIYINLNSVGGNFFSAKTIAHHIKTSIKNDVKIITRVLDDSICMSACPIIFVAGQERHASSNSSFLFHGIKFSSPFRTREQAIDDIKEVEKEFLNTIKNISPKLAAFLEANKTIQDDIDTAFHGDTMFNHFPGFITFLM